MATGRYQEEELLRYESVDLTNNGQTRAMLERQRQYVEHICQSHPDFDAAYQLAQQFVSMLAEHRAEDLDTWLTQAKQSGFPELRQFSQRHTERRECSSCGHHF